jgi:spore germination protein GerM
VTRRAVAVAALLLLPLAGACRKKASPNNPNEVNKVAVRAVRLYYESADLVLMAEPRNVSVPENPAGAISVVARELLKGPANRGLTRVYPPDTVVRAAYLLPDGTALVDLGGPTLTQGWGTGSHEELLAVYSMVQTLAANFPDVHRVRILVNGEPAETLAGHIWLGKSLVPMRGVVDPRAW